MELDDYSINTGDSTNLEEYSTADFISDFETCLGDLRPSQQREITKTKSAAPRPRETTLAPNPFPTSKNNLTTVCPPKTEKPKYRRRILHQNQLLTGTFFLKLRHLGTVNSEIIAMFLLLRKMPQGYRNQLNTHFEIFI